MSLSYYLQLNPVTPDPNDHSARIWANGTLSEEDLVKRCMNYGTGVTFTDLMAAVSLWNRGIIDALAEGYNINTKTANYRAGMNGVFGSAADTFDRSRHVIKASITAGVELAERMRNATVEKILSPQPSPIIIEYRDVNSGTANSILTSGGIGQVVGEELKFNPANPAEGIFFVSATGTESKVTVLASRTEGKLVFSIPAGLAAGTYRLQVRKGYGAAGTLRPGELLDALEVS